MLSSIGLYRGIAGADNEPANVGIVPVYAVPNLLKQRGLRAQDIGLQELSEAFACQALYCRDALDIDPET